MASEVRSLRRLHRGEQESTGVAAHDSTSSSRLGRSLCLVLGVALCACAVAYTTGVAAWLDPLSPMFSPKWQITPLLQSKIDRIRLGYLVAGTLFLGLALAAPRVPPLRAALSRRSSQRVLLVFVVLLPFLVAETALSVFVVPRSRVFEADDRLGWKLRSGVTAENSRALVHVNDKGLRGPLLEYEKPAGTRRILFLGDSVTLGFGLEYEDSYVPLVGRALNERPGRSVEVINAGVDGYSQWQQHEYLKTEGLRYQPDAVVVSFVLNDATERFMLDRFGAPESSASKGYQISLTRDRGPLSQSGILFWIYVRPAIQYLLLGQPIAPPANLQTLTVDHLVQHPDHPLIKQAWKDTLVDLGELFETCRRNSVPVVLVVFPFTFQAQAEALQEPQRLLREFAGAQRVASLDLLPLLEDEAARRGGAVQDFFIDWDHPSPLGSPIIAEHIAGFIEREVAHSW